MCSNVTDNTDLLYAVSNWINFQKDHNWEEYQLLMNTCIREEFIITTLNFGIPNDLYDKCTDPIMNHLMNLICEKKQTFTYTTERTKDDVVVMIRELQFEIIAGDRGWTIKIVIWAGVHWKHDENIKCIIEPKYINVDHAMNE